MYKFLKIIFSILSIILITCVIYFSLFSVPSVSSNLPGNDKTGHLLAYLSFAFSSSISLYLIIKKEKAFIFMFIISIIIGLIIEIIQPYFGRTMELGDFLVDIVGTSIGISFGMVFVKLLLKKGVFEKDN